MVAYGTAFLISKGVNEVLCYLIYLLALVIISGIAHYVNSRVFEWYDDTYKPLSYTGSPIDYLTK